MDIYISLINGYSNEYIQHTQKKERFFLFVFYFSKKKYIFEQEGENVFSCLYNLFINTTSPLFYTQYTENKLYITAVAYKFMLCLA